MLTAPITVLVGVFTKLSKIVLLKISAVHLVIDLSDSSICFPFISPRA